MPPALGGRQEQAAAELVLCSRIKRSSFQATGMEGVPTPHWGPAARWLLPSGAAGLWR